MTMSRSSMRTFLRPGSLARSDGARDGNPLCPTGRRWDRRADGPSPSARPGRPLRARSGRPEGSSLRAFCHSTARPPRQCCMPAGGLDRLCPRRQRDRRKADNAGRRSRTVGRQPGNDRLAVQAAWLHLPELGDLRRHQRRVGLRAARRRAEEQRQAGVVAGDGPGARRHRRPGRRHHHGAPGVGHFRPRRQLH